MPSPLGHVLAGVATAWAADLLPQGSSGRAEIVPAPSRRASPALTVTCAALAALPDVDLVPGLQHRTALHSLSAAIVVMIIAAAVTRWVTGRVGCRVAALCGAAYASHVLLDWLAYDPTWPSGLQVLWPFSHRFFVSGWDVFRATERREVFGAAAIWTNAKAGVQELAILGPPVAWLAWVRREGRDAKRVRPRQTYT
jgi:hypothetical protein